MNKRLLIAVMLPLALTGCAGMGGIPGTSGAAYAPEQARQADRVYLGTVIDVHQVQIEGSGQNAIGTLAGGGLGALAGSEFGNGRGSIVTGVLGAIAGGMAGNAVQQHMANAAGLQITVRLDNGHVVAVTQAADQAFTVGERVQVIAGGGVVRVSPL